VSFELFLYKDLPEACAGAKVLITGRTASASAAWSLWCQLSKMVKPGLEWSKIGEGA
jgi:hypothetical protein